MFPCDIAWSFPHCKVMDYALILWRLPVIPSLVVHFHLDCMENIGLLVLHEMPGVRIAFIIELVEATDFAPPHDLGLMGENVPRVRSCETPSGFVTLYGVLHDWRVEYFLASPNQGTVHF